MSGCREGRGVWGGDFPLVVGGVKQSRLRSGDGWG